MHSPALGHLHAPPRTGRGLRQLVAVHHVRRVGPVLTVMPHRRETEVARIVLGWTASWTKAQALVTVVAAMHLIGAYTLALAPDAQLFTQGTLPVFALFPPQVWAVAFLIGGLGAVSLLRRVTASRQILTWAVVIPTQTVWLGASLIAVLLTGGGSAMMVVYLAGVLAFTTITALVMAHDFTSGKR